jgi:hypothetical protein
MSAFGDFWEIRNNVPFLALSLMAFIARQRIVHGTPTVEREGQNIHSTAFSRSFLNNNRIFFACEWK